MCHTCEEYRDKLDAGTGTAFDRNHYRTFIAICERSTEIDRVMYFFPSDRLIAEMVTNDPTLPLD